jgi:hypothetical protein
VYEGALLRENEGELLRENDGELLRDEDVLGRGAYVGACETETPEPGWYDGARMAAEGVLCT